MTLREVGRLNLTKTFKAFGFIFWLKKEDFQKISFWCSPNPITYGPLVTEFRLLQESELRKLCKRFFVDFV